MQYKENNNHTKTDASEDMSAFEAIVRVVYEQAFESGIRAFETIHRHRESLNLSEWLEFRASINAGYTRAQELIVKELKALEISIDDLRAKIRSTKGKQDSVRSLTKKIKGYELRGRILRGVADAIAWIIIGDDNAYIARLYYAGIANQPRLLKSNVDSVINVINDYRQTKPWCFGLITDITSFCRHGDILFTDGLKHKVIEVKQGAINAEILRTIRSLGKNIDTSEFKNQLRNMDEHYLKQFERTFNQTLRAAEITTIIRNDSGYDSRTGRHVEIGDSNAPRRKYYDILVHMFDELNQRNWAYNIIDDCLLIGIYRGEKRYLGAELLKTLMQKQFEKNYPVFDYMGSFLAPAIEPIFLKPFDKQIIFDIAFGRIKVFLSLHFDKLFDVFASHGIHAKWLSRSETAKLKKSGHDVLSLHNQAIAIKSKSLDLILGDIFLGEILYNNVYPSSVVETYASAKYKTNNT